MPSSNSLDPQSPQARAIYEPAIPSTIIFALIFVIVTGAIICAILRFLARPGEPDPRQTGNRKKIPEMPAARFLIGDRSKYARRRSHQSERKGAEAPPPLRKIYSSRELHLGT
jgi:hypothetical protein